jgi:quercetin dioxygenase-like cupin family protein
MTIVEITEPPGAVAPLHVHYRDDETFYVLEGHVEFLLGEEAVVAGPGDFVNVPRGLVHRFRNAGAETARLVLTFTPAGIEGFFEETLDTAPPNAEYAPDNLEEVAARYAAVAPRYGMTFL